MRLSLVPVKCVYQRYAQRRGQYAPECVRHPWVVVYLDVPVWGAGLLRVLAVVGMQVAYRDGVFNLPVPAYVVAVAEHGRHVPQFSLHAVPGELHVVFAPPCREPGEEGGVPPSVLAEIVPRRERHVTQLDGAVLAHAVPPGVDVLSLHGEPPPQRHLHGHVDEGEQVVCQVGLNEEHRPALCCHALPLPWRRLSGDIAHLLRGQASRPDRVHRGFCLPLIGHLLRHWRGHRLQAVFPLAVTQHHLGKPHLGIVQGIDLPRHVVGRLFVDVAIQRRGYMPEGIRTAMQEVQHRHRPGMRQGTVATDASLRRCGRRYRKCEWLEERQPAQGVEVMYETLQTRRIGWNPGHVAAATRIVHLDGKGVARHTCQGYIPTNSQHQEDTSQYRVRNFPISVYQPFHGTKIQ